MLWAIATQISLLSWRIHHFDDILAMLVSIAKGEVGNDASFSIRERDGPAADSNLRCGRPAGPMKIGRERAA